MPGPIDEDDAATTALTVEEELRRERRRIRELGNTGYQYAGGTEGAERMLLVPLNERLYLAKGDGPLTPLAGTEGAIEAQRSAPPAYACCLCP